MNDTQAFNSVWDALEDDPVKRQNLQLRSELLAVISAHINDKAYKQQEVAATLSTTQARVSALMNGKINQFRLDMLVDFAHRLGLHVAIEVAA